MYLYSNTIYNNPHSRQHRFFQPEYNFLTIDIYSFPFAVLILLKSSYSLSFTFSYSNSTPSILERGEPENNCKQKKKPEKTHDNSIITFILQPYQKLIEFLFTIAIITISKNFNCMRKQKKKSKISNQQRPYQTKH